MSGFIIHQCLTHLALASNHVSDAENLVSTYCAYPDLYYEKRSPETEPYIYFHDGIQFHYPPHTPVEEFYRYWVRDKNTNYPVCHHENENIVHVEAGFRFYLGKIIPLLQKCEREEAWKYLGCLLHFLEDSTFGIHTLEGPDGTDLFVLDRLFGADIAKFLFAIQLPEECHSITVEPKIITADAEELVPLLYARYMRDTARSRQYLFDMAVEYRYGKSHRSSEENIRQMFMVALQLAADTIATILAISSGQIVNIQERKLSEYSPYHYPIGGSGFALQRYAVQENTIIFGVNSLVSLLYMIPGKLYDCFTCNVCGIGIKDVTLELLNQNAVVQTVRLEAEKEIQLKIPSPSDTMGFRIKSSVICGQIRITNGIFHR